MPRRPDLPCAGCGVLMWRGKGSLPEGEAKCRACRREPTEVNAAAKAAAGAKRSKPTKAAAPKKRPPLRAVRDGEPAPPDPDADADAEETPEDPIVAQRKRLEQIRRRVAQTIDDPDTSARDLAALINRELELAALIRALDQTAGKAGSVIAASRAETWDQNAI